MQDLVLETQNYAGSTLKNAKYARSRLKNAKLCQI